MCSMHIEVWGLFSISMKCILCWYELVFGFETLGFPVAQLVKNSSAMLETLVQILGSGRSAGEGIGYPLQYSWVSLVAQLVKNPPAMQETPGSIPGLGRSAGEGIGYPLQYSWASLGGSAGKESTCNVGDLGSIPGLGRSPGEGNWRTPPPVFWSEEFHGLFHRVAKSWTQWAIFSMKCCHCFGEVWVPRKII